MVLEEDEAIFTIATDVTKEVARPLPAPVGHWPRSRRWALLLGAQLANSVDIGDLSWRVCPIKK